MQVFASLLDSGLDWESLSWLRSVTHMRLVVKGVLRVMDAVEAVRRGCDAIWLSNHGGRQLDTVPAPIEVLPAVLAAVPANIEVYVDGGVTRGTDVLKVQ